MASSAPRVRRSLIDIQRDYDNGNKTELENLMRAWRGIKALDHDALNSFFTLGGYHGEPFAGPGATNGQWWGGYCQHGTVLFPSWHRAYLYRLEEALRSIPGCQDVTLPFWDECSPESLASGIPHALTDPYFTLDGEQIDNPLRSYVFPVDIVDQIPNDNPVYSKPAGYETVRYPLSGLVGTAADRAATAAHNARFPNPAANVLTLNANIVSWLNWPMVFPQGQGQSYTTGLVHQKFVRCLDAPNYTLFSNTTSQKAWNDGHKGTEQIIALENPHNAIHLAVGGFDVPGVMNASAIRGANGDMGENDTAGLDPIFFFHHCFIDYTFWIWQRRHGATASFTIDENDPGASYVLGGNNSPPNGADPNAKMTLDTALKPFPSTDGERIMTTRDVIDIEAQLGYTYGPGSLDQFAEAPTESVAAAPADAAATRVVHVAGLNRGKIKGSFAIAAYAEVDGLKRLVDVDPVLSRWSVENCANCQNHLEATADFVVPAAAADNVEIRVHTRGGLLGGSEPPEHSAGFVEGVATATSLPFTVEVR